MQACSLRGHAAQERPHQDGDLLPVPVNYQKTLGGFQVAYIVISMIRAHGAGVVCLGSLTRFTDSARNMLS